MKEKQMREFYLNHDGNMDDYASLLLMLLAPDIRLIGVGVTDADGYVEPAVAASRKIIDRFNQRHDEITVAQSNSRAVHQFPDAWRVAAYSVNQFPLLNEHGCVKTPLSDLPAHQHLIECLHQATGPVTLVFTGPLTDLARALETDPTITHKIATLYWMGGSQNGRGNVHMPNADGTQEWNAWWDPAACATVWDSDLDIYQIGLESSEELPVTPAMHQHFATNRRYQAFDLLGNIYALVNSAEVDTEYYLWDVLTVMAALFPEIVTTEEVKSTVLTTGSSAARFERDETGRGVTLVTHADSEKFWRHYDQLCKHAELF